MTSWTSYDFRLAPIQWETVLQSNAISHWLGTDLESALWLHTIYGTIWLADIVSAKGDDPGLFLMEGLLGNLLWSYHIEYMLCDRLGSSECISYEKPCSLMMMMSSNGNIFHVTGPLCWEFTGHRWIPHTMASDAKLGCFLWPARE